MKKIYILITTVLFSLKTNAQEVNLPQYLNYLGDNPFVITPAYVGIGSGMRLRLNGSTQWVGIKNAPQTQEPIITKLESICIPPQKGHSDSMLFHCTADNDDGRSDIMRVQVSFSPEKGE